ncbi:DUF21 domain-containing protein [bacterium]|nr:DUF21 domain-containing protein [bacterium]
MTALALYTLIFLFLSGLMAAIDAAVLSVSRPEIEELIHNRRAGARILRDLKQHLARTVVVIVILTNTINVLGPILVSQQAVNRFGRQSLVLLTAVLAISTIVFSEILPKAIGAHHAPLVGRLSAGPLRAIELAIYPLVSGLAWLSGCFTRSSRPIGTERQVRALAMMGRRAGHIEGDEILMIYKAFRLNDSIARDIMTPREDVVGIAADDTVREAAEQVRHAGFSRYPVYRDSLDHIHGFVTGRDILEAILSGRDDDPVTSITRPVLRFTATQRSDDMLVVFRDEHIHLGVVGTAESTIGIVTLEDVLEELVGPIEDEKD